MTTKLKRIDSHKVMTEKEIHNNNNSSPIQQKYALALYINNYLFIFSHGLKSVRSCELLSIVIDTRF